MRLRCYSAKPQSCQVISSLIKKNRFILSGGTLCLQLLPKLLGAGLRERLLSSQVSHKRPASAVLLKFPRWEKICTLERKFNYSFAQSEHNNLCFIGKHCLLIFKWSHDLQSEGKALLMQSYSHNQPLKNECGIQHFGLSANTLLYLTEFKLNCFITQKTTIP